MKIETQNFYTSRYIIGIQIIGI